jgi:hypothetical protein
MAPVFLCVILVPVTMHDVICKIKYVILYLCLVISQLKIRDFKRNLMIIKN